jgi:outer membrane lipoprotein-sorting protein
MPFRRALACVALASLAAPLRAGPQPVPAPELARYDAGFAAVQQATRTFRADITQTLHLQGLAKPVVSTGTLYYASPDKLLIRFSQPAGEWMLVNGPQAAIQKAGRPLERHDLNAQGRGASHAASLLDFFHADPARWHQDFDVSMTRDGDLLAVRLTPWMTPTATAQGAQEIITTLQLPRYDITGMTVTINAGNSIDYRFAHGARNAALDPGLFKIPAP